MTGYCVWIVVSAGLVIVGVAVYIDDPMPGGTDINFLCVCSVVAC